MTKKKLYKKNLAETQDYRDGYKHEQGCIEVLLLFVIACFVLYNLFKWTPTYNKSLES